MDKKYLSKYSNGKYVTEAQYVTELICENKAKKDKLDLHYRFWTTKRWSLYYRNQIASANKLLDKYPINAIIKALKEPDGQKIYSLRAPHLPAIIDRCLLDIEQQNKTLTKELVRDNNNSFRKNKQNSNILTKLRNIDNDS
jgi:enolase